jgi:perosamine synthetase
MSPSITTESTAQLDGTTETLRSRPSAHINRVLPFSVPDLDESELSELTETLRSGWLSAGPKTRKFEQEFAKFVGVKHAIAVNTGTTAFQMALRLVDLQPGDEVILTPFAPGAAAELIRTSGATPRFLDVTEDGLHLAPELLGEAIHERTKAILVSHVAGLPAEMDPLLTIARRHDVTVIEDAGQALSATYRHDKVGGLGDVACFTFFAQKALSLGEGGVVCTNRADFAERCRLLAMSPWDLIPPTLEVEAASNSEPAASFRYLTETSTHGQDPPVRSAGGPPSRRGVRRMPFDEAQLLALSADGYQAAMPDLSAAIGLAQLRKAKAMWHRRREIAVNYNVSFSRFVELQCPADRDDSQHAWHLYLLRLNLQRLRCSRNQFLAELRARGIAATVMQPPLHLQPVYAALGFRPEDCPIAAQEYAREISLPIYSRMTDDDVEHVVSAVEAIVKRFRAIPHLPR